MLPKQHRLHTTKEISQVRKLGARYASDHFLVFLVVQDDAPASQFAFVVSTKVSKLAVRRNRTKRLLRESVRALLPQLTKPVSAVLVAKSDVTAVPLQAVLHEVSDIFSKANVVKTIRSS